MGLISPLAALLGLEVGALTDRVKRAAIAYAIIAIFAIIALVFALVAINVALTQVVGPIWAPLIIAGAALVIALIAWLIFGSARGARKARAVEKKRSSETTALVTTAALTALPMLLRSPMTRNLLLPAAAAFAAYTFLIKPSNDDEDA